LNLLHACVKRSRYLPRLTAVLEQQQAQQQQDGEPQHHSLDLSTAEGEDSSSSGSGGGGGGGGGGGHRLSLLRRLLGNETAIEALRLPHYVFDGQIEQKLPEFEDELLGCKRSIAYCIAYCRAYYTAQHSTLHFI
jgi:hypothetical protein